MKFLCEILKFIFSNQYSCLQEDITETEKKQRQEEYIVNLNLLNYLNLFFNRRPDLQLKNRDYSGHAERWPET